jgi:hypothetical protein
VSPGVDSVIFAPQVVCRIVHLHCLHRVDRIVRNYDSVAFLVREGMITIANI